MSCRKTGHSCETQVAGAQSNMTDFHLEVGYRLDLLVDDMVIVEIKRSRRCIRFAMRS